MSTQNRFNTEQGHPYKIDDLTVIEARLLEVMQAVTLPWVNSGQQHVKLDGADVTDTGTQVNVTAGYIAWDGEIVRVPAHSVSYSPGNFIGWVLLETESQPREYQDGIIRNTKLTKEVRIQVFPSQPANYVPVGNISSWKNTILKATNEDGFTLYGPTITPGAGNISGVSTQLRYKQLGQTLLLNWFISGSLSASTTQIEFSLPAGLSSVGSFYGLSWATQSQKLACYTRTSSGIVRVENSFVAGNVTLEGQLFMHAN